MSVKDPLAAVARRRDRLLAAALKAQAAFDAAGLPRLCEALLAALPAGCRLDALYQSLAPLAGTTPDRPTLRRLCWALAADPRALKAGRAVWPVRTPHKPAPVSLRVLACRPLPQRKAADPTETDARLRFRVLVADGAGAPQELDVTWGRRFVAYLARRPDGLGFARPPRGERAAPGRPYQSPETLVGMTLKAALSTDPAGRARLDQLRCTPLMRAYNRALTEMRFRNGFACPFAYTHPCHKCERGQDECPAACRPLSLVTRPCPACHRDALHDPYWGAKACTHCCATGRVPLA